MSSNSTSLAPRDDELDELVFSYLELRDDGAAHQAALESALASAPHRAADLRRSLETLRATGLIAPEGAGAENFPESIGGYRLLRRLGSGGMGVVFLAQGEAQDPVALKLIRPEQLYFDRARARFQRELDSASRLDHECIAQVLASGEEAGIPYLAQRWVPGASLDALLSELRSKSPESLSGAAMLEALKQKLPPEAATSRLDEAAFSNSWELTVLDIVRQMARALEHAHAHGVLHRDVKPSNIMLMGTGRAVLVDFGLASIPDGEALTRTGAQPGSLPYMSPEQVDGSPRDLDERTDVYALGVTLYELLTLRQPFKSGSVERVRARIMESSPLPLRKLNGQVRKATEVLCLKAMDREPRRRYCTAGALAEDIERLIAGRPIAGRAPGPWVHFVRWAKRKPLHAASLLVAIAAPLGWAAMSRANLAEVQGAYLKEQEAKAMLESHLGLTLQAIRRLFADLASESIDDTPHLQRTRLVAIELALEVLDELCAERPLDLGVLAERGHLVRQRADFLGGLSRYSEAIEGYSQHIEIYTRLVESAGPDLRLKYLRQLSLSTERRASLLLLLEDKGAGLAGYEEALKLLREVAGQMPIDSGAHAQLAVALEIYTHALRKIGRLEEALASVEEGLAIAEQVMDVSPNNPQALQCAANLLSARALVRQQANLPQDELEEQERVIDLLRRALAMDPTERDILRDFSQEAAHAAHTISDYGDQEAALSLSSEAVEAARYLVDSFPTIDSYKASLVQILATHAGILSRSNMAQAANQLLREQAEVACEYYRANPTDTDARETAITVLNNFAVSELFYSGDAEAVFRTLDRARDLLKVAFEANPNKLYLKELELAVDYTAALMTLLSDRPEEGFVLVEQFEVLADVGHVKWQSNVADLWAEFVACVQRNTPGESELMDEGRDRAFGALNRAVDDGFRSKAKLLASSMFETILQPDPRWKELLERVDEK